MSRSATAETTTSAQRPLRRCNHRWFGLIRAAAAGAVLGATVTLCARPAGAQSCIGDCNASGSVTIDDLIRGVAIALGSAPASQCSALDANSDGTVSVDELITAVNNALSGECQPVLLIAGSCARPASGQRRLVPCDDGTPVRAYDCEARKSDCVEGGSRQVLAEGRVAGGQGRWGFAIASDGIQAGALLALEAEVEHGVVFRTVALGSASVQSLASAKSARTGDDALHSLEISPVTEASVRLLADNGLDNFSNDEITALFTAVDQATVDLSFADLSPADAADAATQVAGQDPTVIMVIENALPPATPTYTTTTTATPTATNTRTDTATATPTTTPAGRYADNRDGTITDTLSQLVFEKKGTPDGMPNGANLHDVRATYLWAGTCSDQPTKLCQPDAAAAALCTAGVIGDPTGCDVCDAGEGTCTVDVSVLGTIWSWLAQLNAGSGYAGHTDWRIPSVAELQSIIRYDMYDPAVDAGFDGPSCGVSACADLADPACSCTSSGTYWPSETRADLPTGTLLVYYVYGGTFEADKNYAAVQEGGAHVRAVRGGTAPTIPRYVDNADGTIRDRQTGLAWEKKVASPDAGLHARDTAYEASGTCSALPSKFCQPNVPAAAACAAGTVGYHVGCDECTAAEGTCIVTSPIGATIWDWLVQLNSGAGFADHTDWRIPTIAELQSIVEPTLGPPVVDPAFEGASCGASCTDLTSPACSCTVSYYHYSATTRLDTGHQWIASFATGRVESLTNTNAFYVRAVRTGM